MRHLIKLCRDTRGNSFIEMGLMLPILASLLVGAVDISRAVSDKLAIEQAAQRTIERLQVKDFTFNDQVDDRSVYQSEAAAAAGVATGNVTVNAWLACNGTVQTPMDQSHYNGTCSTGQVMARYVSVQIQKNFTPMFGTRFFPGANDDGTFTLKSKAGVRVQ